MNEMMKKCTNCGWDVRPEFKFCMNCGCQVKYETELENIVDTVIEAPEEKPVTSHTQKPYYSYAKYIASHKANSLQFQEADGNILYMPYSYVEEIGVLKSNEYYWLWVFDRGERKVVKPAMPDEEHKRFEFFYFASKYKENDRLVLPVKCVNDTYCKVMIGPCSYVNIPRDEIDQNYRSADIVSGMPYRFIVRKITQKGRAFEISLGFDGCEKCGEVEQLYGKIPNSISDIVIPKSILDRLSADPEKCDILTRSIGKINQENLARFINYEYQKQINNKTLLVEERNREVYIDVDLGIRDANGVPLKACVNRKRDRDRFVLSLVGGTTATKEMERFVYIPDWEKFCDAVTSVSLHEIWGYDEKDKYSILKSYLTMTFYKAKLDDLLVETEAGALFNTGLVDDSYDEVFCFLKREVSVNDPCERELTLGFFACRGKGENGKLLNSMFAEFPPVPSYVNRDHIEDIYFDTTKALSCDYHHILQDNYHRLPRKFFSQTLAYDPEIRKWDERHGNLDEIIRYILDKPSLVKALEDQLKNAVDTAVKYCKWNYKTAIPIYYPRTNSITLLLPLIVVKGSNSVDTALVVQLLANGNYQGQTILTLEMAYNDARQICRPNSEWLTFKAIKSSVRANDEVI